jgi:F0F1-type ATP synthase assembly protein I
MVDITNGQSDGSEKPWWHAGMVVFAEVTGWIAAPIIIGLFLGRWLDERNKSEPWFYLLCTGIAFIVSSIGIVIVATKYIRQIDRESRSKKNAQATQEKQAEHHESNNDNSARSSRSE